MSEHADSDPSHSCPHCGASRCLSRCYREHPSTAEQPEATLAEWTLLPGRERLVLVLRWLDLVGAVTALNVERPETTPAQAGNAARRMARFVRMAGGGDLDAGVDRLLVLRDAQRLVA